MEREVATFLQKKYAGKLTSVESIAKEDLDLVSKTSLAMHLKNVACMFETANE